MLGLLLDAIWLSRLLCGLDLVLLRNYGDFDRIGVGFDADGLLHIVVRLLDSVEALDLVVGEAVDLVRQRWHCLYEANHALVALRVELAIVARLQVGHLCEFCLCRRSWRVVFKRVAEVGQEA